MTVTIDQIAWIGARDRAVGRRVRFEDTAFE